MFLPAHAGVIHQGAHAKTIDYLARTGERPGAVYRWWLDQLVRDWLASGFFSCIAMGGFGTGLGANSFKVNFASSAHAAGALVGTYTHTPGRGVLFSGAGYFDPNVAWSAFEGASLSRNGCLVYVMSDRASATTYAIGSTGGGATIGVRPKSGTTSQALNGTVSTSLKTTGAAGLKGVVRDGADGYWQIEKDQLVFQATGALAAFPTGRPFIGRLGQSGAYDVDEIGFWAFLRGDVPITTAKLVAGQQALDRFMFGIGAASRSDIYPEPESTSPPHAFAPMPTLSPAMKVFQQAGPPGPDDTNLTFPYGPGTDWETFRASALTGPRLAGAQAWYMEWAPRSSENPNLSANIVRDLIKVTIGGVVRNAATKYTTGAKAIAAGLARHACANGFAAYEADGVSGYRDIADAAGVTWLEWSDANTNAASIFTNVAAGNATQAFAWDVVVGPEAAVTDNCAIDFETAVGGAANTLALLLPLASMSHAKNRLIKLYTNPWNGGNAKAEGLTDPGVLDQLYDAYDYLGPLVHVGSGDVVASLKAQLSLLSPSRSFAKIIPTIGINGLSADQARALRPFIDGSAPWMDGRMFAGVDFWRNGFTAGGDSARLGNQVIGILTGLIA